MAAAAERPKTEKRNRTGLIDTSQPANVPNGADPARMTV
jgi:hypothetical protein